MSDNRSGIGKEGTPKIFDKFYRVKIDANLIKGIGLSLYLVKQVIVAQRSA